MGTKVVYNACYGGFSLSDAAVRLGRELSGDPKWGGFVLIGEMYDDGSGPRGAPYKDVDMTSLFRDSNHPDNLERHDATLVAVVERLGDAANGQHAKLSIEVVEGSRYRIDEYDGSESVQTPDDIAWIEVGA